MSNQESSVRGPAVMTVYSSWDDIRSGLEPGEVIHVDTDTLPYPARVGFERSFVSVRGWTSRKVFHDGRRYNSLRIYVHDDHYKAVVVKHNPDSGTSGAISHALSDAPLKTALALSVGAGLYQTARASKLQRKANDQS